MAAPSGGVTAGDATLHRALAMRAVEPTTPEERGHAVAGLLALAGDRVEPLEGVRAEFQRRLARRSDDFEATHALRLVERALVQAARPPGRQPGGRSRRGPASRRARQ